MTNYFRDVSRGLRKLRDFLLGRQHTLHGRFPPCLAPRTIPPPVITRGPDWGYANKYYFKRNAFHSVQPPVVAPVAEGPPLIQDPTMKVQTGGIRADAVNILIYTYNVAFFIGKSDIAPEQNVDGRDVIDSDEPRGYVTFSFAPTPGLPWWWDGHCYYDYVPDPPCNECPPEPPCPTNPCPPTPDQTRR